MKIKGFVFAIISAVFFGSAGIFVKNGYSENFSPVDLLMLQYIIAGIILLFISLGKYSSSLRLSKPILKKLFIQGAVFNTLMTVFFYSSFKYLDVSVATMLLYIYPAMVAAASFLFFKQKVSKIKITAITGTFIGCILVLNLFSNNLNHLSINGIVYGILGAVFYAAMNIYAENIVENVPPVVVTFYTTIFSLIILVIFNIKFIDKLQFVSYGSIKNAALLAFFCEIIPLTFLYSAIKYIGPVTTSIISSLELPSSAILSFLFMGERLSFVQILGIIIVIYSVILLKKNE